MQIIQHRVNRISQLKLLPRAFGAEVDIRSRSGKLILAHEPGTSGDSLEGFLKKYARRRFRGPLIVNVKEDGHEPKIMSLLRRNSIRNFFFLDVTFPTLIRRFVRPKNRHVAVRVSEYEPYEVALQFKGLVNWVWLDCFSGRPPAPRVLKALSPHFQICVVSPELQGYGDRAIQRFQRLRSSIDAVCTKRPAAWEERAKGR